MPDLYTYLITDDAILKDKMIAGWETKIDFESTSNQNLNGKKDESLPFILDFNCPSDFAEWHINECHGHGWSIFAQTELSIIELRNHLNKFFTFNKDSGNELFFKLYLPNVFRVFLPTCSNQQLKDFFGLIKTFIVEHENANYILKFELENGNLVTKRILANEFWKSLVVWNIPADLKNLPNQQESIVTPYQNSSESIPDKKRNWSFMVE